MKRTFILNAILLGLFTMQVRGQNLIINSKNVVVGLTKGVYILNTKRDLINNLALSCCQTYTQGMYLRRYINEHVALEASISFNNPLYTNRNNNQKTFISIPISAQYHYNRKRKFQPYVGVGVLYLYQKISTENIQGTDKIKNNAEKKFDIEYTQGILYNVNTKIEISESVHLVPKSADNCPLLGIELDIGFKLL